MTKRYKNDIAESIYARNRITKTQAKNVIDNTFERIIEYLERGEDVCISGFGRFDITIHKGRTVRNAFGKGQDKQMRGGNRVKFHSYDHLTAQIND